MAGSDAIVVHGEWISQHYFTTDATKESFNARVRARRKDWEAEREVGTPRTRLTAARQELLAGYATLDAADDPGAVSELNEQLRDILGYGRLGLTADVDGPIRLIRAAGLEEPVLAIVDARPPEAIEDLVDKQADNLAAPWTVGDEELTSVARALSRLFVGEEPRPAFALVLAGPYALVAERERWPEGRFLTVDLHLVLERADDKQGGETDRMLACLAADSLAPDADGDIWWTATLEESVRHTVGVSQDLREGVRLSIEIIANEVVRRRAAQELDPLPADQAQPLAKQALRFLYRILFLLYAEASPELGVLPAGAPEYEQGYSLDRLRDLTIVELSTPHAKHGTHLYESLAVLFHLVDQGHDPQSGNEGGSIDGLTFRPLRADLFASVATSMIDEVKLGNEAVQEVLQHLLLSKASAGRDRGFISYAELGINQLGAVYEGLMSYTGFFAESDLYEVAKGGNAEKGSWVVPVERAQGIADEDFVCVGDPITGESKPVLHNKGAFVFRLAGRERQQSASYYTPEVLTRFVVSQALEELLDQDGTTTSAEEILQLTVCEPALGSGAFAIEAVRQLAEEYLRRRQHELDETIDPDAYPRELQRVKAYLALHQTYGVDLNATAVELAEISLWLDTMVEGLEAPWFGLRLRRGNSLIGARRAVYSASQVKDKAWLQAAPTRVMNAPDTRERIGGAIPHFLLPAEGWGAAVDVGKDVKALAGDAVAALRTWRKQVRAKPKKAQVDQLVDLGHRVDRLWDLATQRLDIAATQSRRDIPLWGRDELEMDAPGRAVTREEIEASLADPEGAYRRLRRVMDAWCALWFWPLTETDVTPPTVEQWLDAMTLLLGRHDRVAERRGQLVLSEAKTWDELGDLEQQDLTFAGALALATVLETHPWLRVCERVAAQQGFFHWELEFAEVFETRGGFDLQVGNPPWVRPRSDVETLMAEGDPWWVLATKPTQAEKQQHREATLALSGIPDLVIDATADLCVMSEYLGWKGAYPHLAGLQPNLYRCFMERTWTHQSPSGVSGLIHPETHFTDDKAGVLRAATYRRLRRHWQFINELQLFEIQHQKWYGVHVYADELCKPRFRTASMLYHPDTVERSLQHDGTGPEPGLKDDEGNWDVRPHRGRILNVDDAVIGTWHDIVENDETPVLQARQVYTVNTASQATLAQLASAPRIGDLPTEFSAGWHESMDRQKGRFDVDWGQAASWDDVILQGPHIFVANPFYKSPNGTMANHLDWSPVDLETLSPNAVPTTSYKPVGDRAAYDAAYPRWGEQGRSARGFYRVAWRSMAANTGERTLIAAVIPPGAAHVHGVSSVGLPGDVRSLVVVGACVGTMLSDFLIRAVPKSGISQDSLARLAIPSSDFHLTDELVLRALRLNALTDAYAGIWADALESTNPATDSWTGGLEYSQRPALGEVSCTWSSACPLRRASDRRQAQLEIDTLVALSLGVTADQLCTIYRTQFPVLYSYDRHRDYYDGNGRLVPNEVLTIWRKNGDALSADERTHTNASGNTYVYEIPFVTLDRELDMRRAYAHFDRLLGEAGDG